MECQLNEKCDKLKSIINEIDESNEKKINNYNIDDSLFQILIKCSIVLLEIIKNCIIKKFKKGFSENDIKKFYNSKKNKCVYSIICYIFNVQEVFQFRYGQLEAYEIFKKKLELDNYWGLMIAPTGWGKSMMHYLFIGYFFNKFNKNILLITKRKDILSDVINEIQEEIFKLKKKGLFPNIEIEVYDQVSKKLNYKKINRYTKYSIIITNTDKLITRNKENKNFDPTILNKINWANFGLVLFDEVHWAGSTRTVQFMEYLKNKISYGIGSSATPIRKSLDNQDNIKKLYGKNYNIMYELTYVDAWNNNVILKVDTIIFPIKKKLKKKNNSKNNNNDITNESKEIIIKKIKNILDISYKKKIIIFFKSRLHLLTWYSYFIKKNSFINMLYDMSFTYSKSIYNSDSDSENNSDSDSENNSEKKKSLEEKIMKLIKDNNIQFKNIDKGIENFKEKKSNAILLVVGRANEGFNDPLVDICVNLDFSKNKSMLLTLQKMGRTQRLDNNKQKGYYICPIISDNNNEFLEIIAQNLHSYIKATSENSVKYNKFKSIPNDLLNEIILSLKVEGNFNYTNDDIMKRIRLIEKEQDMTLEQFIENLKTYNINNPDKYYEIYKTNEYFKELGMPRFCDSINGFSWSLVNNNNYYDENKIIKIIFNIYDCNIELFDNFNDYNDIRDKLHEIDNKIPNEYPWVYYNIDKNNFSFIYN